MRWVGGLLLCPLACLVAAGRPLNERNRRQKKRLRGGESPAVPGSNARLCLAPICKCAARCSSASPHWETARLRRASEGAFNDGPFFFPAMLRNAERIAHGRLWDRSRGDDDRGKPPRAATSSGARLRLLLVRVRRGPRERMSSALREARQRHSASQGPIKHYDEDGVARGRKRENSLDDDAADADEKDSSRFSFFSPLKLRQSC